MIWLMYYHDFHLSRPVNLFCQNQPCHLVCQCYLAKTEPELCPFPQRIAVTIRTSDKETEMAAYAVTIFFSIQWEKSSELISFPFVSRRITQAPSGTYFNSCSASRSSALAIVRGGRIIRNPFFFPLLNKFHSAHPGQPFSVFGYSCLHPLFFDFPNADYRKFHFPSSSPKTTTAVLV